MMDILGFKNLGPDGASLLEKFEGNSFLGANKQDFCVALRIARVNHACQPNAATIYDETARVAILFAQRDIQPNEQIFTSYYAPFFSLLPKRPSSHSYAGMNPEWNVEEEFNFMKNEMISTYGITCPADCSCNDPAILTLVQEGRQLHASVLTLARQLKIEEAVVAGEKLLNVHRRLNISWIYRGYTDYILFLIAIRKLDTLPRAKEYIRSAVELFRNICPYSERLTKTYEKLLEHPETHPNFMMMD